MMEDLILGYSTIPIRLDIGGGTGTFAARMKERNVTIITIHKHTGFGRSIQPLHCIKGIDSILAHWRLRRTELSCTLVDADDAMIPQQLALRVG
ncbi:ATRAD3, putative [Arachis hypogaea]|uniref:ATRAD3, putative n=1 Tax=Arachis hypogaea TaxID=3818 RepID=A0A444XU37_ARAHY|nr:ATRAD3, putative [Arachis hypogaea]RYQ93297.1 hypothetical protein Ahy_B09g099565 [Arachis hypogaea]